MRVSALTIIHNRAHLFADTIRSVLNQSYAVHELIIIDDGSTDHLAEVIAEFNDPRIAYFYYDRIGVVSKLRNLALSKSTGELIAFIDSDDLWHKDKIKFHVEATHKFNSDISFSDCQQFNSKGHIGKEVAEELKGIQKVDVFKELVDHNLSLTFGTNLFFKKEISGMPVRFDERLFLGEHDLCMMICASHKSFFIPKVLNYIRRHDNNISQVGSIIDIIGPLEYNRTLDKLLNQQLISKSRYQKTKALNCCKAGGYYMEKKIYRKSFLYLTLALRLNARFFYFKIITKIIILMIRDHFQKYVLLFKKHQYRRIEI